MCCWLFAPGAVRDFSVGDVFWNTLLWPFLKCALIRLLKIDLWPVYFSLHHVLVRPCKSIILGMWGFSGEPAAQAESHPGLSSWWKGNLIKWKFHWSCWKNSLFKYLLLDGNCMLFFLYRLLSVASCINYLTSQGLSHQTRSTMSKADNYYL